MSHDALRNLLNKHVSVARRHCASLKKKHVTPHSLRHSLAMELLQNGVDRSVIALWLVCGDDGCISARRYDHERTSPPKGQY